jgi:putative peptidoglycan lipid II flippase
MVAGLLQLLFQIPSLYGLDLVPRPRWDTKHPGVKRILTLMIPALFGVSVSQINLLLDTVLASLLPAGSVSWLYYSDRLTELPLGIFAIAVATVILPNLSSQQARAKAADKDPAFAATLHWALGPYCLSRTACDCGTGCSRETHFNDSISIRRVQPGGCG